MSATARPRTGTSPSLDAIQAPIRDRLDAAAGELRRIVIENLPLFAAQSEHVMRMRGKMFRPTLLLLASQADGEEPERAVALAACVELMHLATLVHDDAVDHSAMRRGMPTINSLFTHQTSVILGDYLYSRTVHELVRRSEFDALRVLADAAVDMTVGEMRQLAAFDALAFSEEDYDLLITAKTASLMSAACAIGALAGAPRLREPLARYGLMLGMAFQVADDLLDYTADQAETGKPTGLDLREHKVTLPLIYALPRMSAAARRAVEALFASDSPEDRQVADVIELVREYGGIDDARRRGERLASEAEEALGPLPATPARDALHLAIAYVMDRRW